MYDLLIWGTGNIARIMLEMIEHKKIAFIDNNMQMQGNEFLNIGKVYSPGQVNGLQYGVIVICVNDADDILEQCRDLRLENVLYYHDFIAQELDNKTGIFKQDYYYHIYKDAWNLAVKNILRVKVQPIIEEIKNINDNSLDSSYDNDGKKYVWSCWWQGEEYAPKMITKCLESQRKVYNKDSGYTYIVITKDNYKEYIDFPDYILEKLGKTMTITCLSDILRFKLLAKYGGLWLDATVYTPNTLDIDESLVFYSPKDLSKNRKRLASMCYMRKTCKLAEYMDMLYMFYFKTEEKILDYFQVGRFIDILYEEVPSIKKAIDVVPENNKHYAELRIHSNEEYNKDLWHKWNQDTCFFKMLSIKEYVEYTEDNKLTFYGALMNGIL
jgi:hypothetical protein